MWQTRCRTVASVKALPSTIGVRSPVVVSCIPAVIIPWAFSIEISSLTALAIIALAIKATEAASIAGGRVTWIGIVTRIAAARRWWRWRSLTLIAISWIGWRRLRRRIARGRRVALVSTGRRIAIVGRRRVIATIATHIVGPTILATC